MDRGGGAERIASDLARTLAERGFDSNLAVGHRYGTESASHLIPNDAIRSGWARSLLGRAPGPTGPHTPLTHVQRTLRIGLKALAEPGRTMARAMGREDFDFPGTALLPDITGKRADILHLHNLHGSYFDLRMLPALSSAVPTVLTAHDMWLATGHCAYSMDCDRWRWGCGSCPYPHTLPGITRDATRANVRVKRRIYERSSIHLVGPSQWVLDTLTASMLQPAIASTTLMAGEPNGDVGACSDTFDDLRCVVLGAVVDDDDLDRFQRLGETRIEGFFDGRRSVERRHHDRDGDIAHSRFSTAPTMRARKLQRSSRVKPKNSASTS